MSNDLFDLTGVTAAVIGGTGVLGGAMAVALGAAGAKVAVLGRNEQRGGERARIMTLNKDFSRARFEHHYLL